jgi:hypothetical protein
MNVPRQKTHHPSHEVRFERAAYFGLILPSHSVALVKSGNNRSARLPATCDVCLKMITNYPFIAKESSGHRKYHINCALKVGIVSLIPNRV